MKEKYPDAKLENFSKVSSLERLKERFGGGSDTSFSS